MQTTSDLTVEVLHERFMVLGKTFSAHPSSTAAQATEDAYRAFYVAYVGSSEGIEDAVDDLRSRMADRMMPR